jgi:hypothetical protein
LYEDFFKQVGIITIVAAIGFTLVGLNSCKAEVGGIIEITNYSSIRVNINIIYEDNGSWVVDRFIDHGETVRVDAVMDVNYRIRVFPTAEFSVNVKVTPESITIAEGNTVKVSIFNDGGTVFYPASERYRARE